MHLALHLRSASMSKRRIATLFVAAAALGVILSITRHMVAGPPFEDTTAFSGVTNIVFTGRGAENQRTQMEVTEVNEVAHMVSLIHLQRKDHCACAHSYEAIFQKPSGEIRVSFCTHCFDVLDSTNPQSYEGARLYRMPKEFYAEFRRLAQTQIPDWNVPAPRLKRT